MAKKKSRPKWPGIVTIILVLLLLLVIIGVITRYSEQDTHDKAVQVTQGNDAVRSFIEQAPDHDVNTRTPTSAEINEYPVIYQDTEEPVLVQYSHQSQGLLCVVDNGEVIRCFNNIDIG